MISPVGPRPGGRAGLLLAVSLLVTGLAGRLAAQEPVPSPTETPVPPPTETPVPRPVPVTLPAPPAAPWPTPSPPPAEPTPPADEGLIPRLNLYLPEGQVDFRLSKLVKSSLFETEFEYDFVSGDIAAFLRYKYYGSRQTLLISGFDTIRFRSIERVSTDFDRTRGFNTLLRWPLSFQKRVTALLEFDRLSFSKNTPDDNRSNVFLKLAYQFGTQEDYRSNEIAGDPNDRIRNLFTAYREIGPNGRGLSMAVSYGAPVAHFNYLKAEAEALQILDVKRFRFIGRVHAGYFPYRPFGPPEDSSANKPFRIPAGELFQLDGRTNLKGSKSSERGAAEFHVTLETFVPVFENKSMSFLKLTWSTLHLVGYFGTGNLGDDLHTFSRVSDWKQDVGLGWEVSFAYRNYRVFLSGLAARVLQDGGSPKFLFTLRGIH